MVRILCEGTKKYSSSPIRQGYTSIKHKEPLVFDKEQKFSGVMYIADEITGKKKKIGTWDTLDKW